MGRIAKNETKPGIIWIQVQYRHKCNTSPSADGDRSKGQNRLPIGIK